MQATPILAIVHQISERASFLPD